MLGNIEDQGNNENMLIIFLLGIFIFNCLCHFLLKVYLNLNTKLRFIRLEKQKVG